MLCFMIDARGRIRIGETVKAVMAWEGYTGVGLDSTGKISRATINRAKRGDVISDVMLRALGDALGLPRDYLLYVGAGDTRKIEASGAEPDLIRWTIDLIVYSPSEDDDATGQA
ncbi:MAG TPA: hypothetical protein VIQ30_26705 [Pseudonocardia sp.]